jgi:DUF438 domain-containing protein
VHSYISPFGIGHTGQGGPVPPTVMDFDDDKIRHMTKIWNAGFAMRELGWA